MTDKKVKQQNNIFYEESRVYGTEKALKERKGEALKHSRRGDDTTIQRLAFVVLVLLLIVIVAFAFKTFMPEKEKKQAEEVTGTEKNDITGENANVSDNSSEAVHSGEDFYVVVLSVNSSERKIYGYDVKTAKDIVLDYDIDSRFSAKLGSKVTAASYEKGTLLHVEMRADENIVSKAYWDDGMWERTRVKDLEFDHVNNKLMFRGDTYEFAGELCIMYEGEKIIIEELPLGKKIYTVRGIGESAYEIILTEVLPLDDEL